MNVTKLIIFGLMIIIGLFNGAEATSNYFFTKRVKKIKSTCKTIIYICISFSEK